MISPRQKQRIWAGSIFAILFFFGGHYAYAASSISPTSGTSGEYTIFVDGATDADSACIYDTSGAVIVPSSSLDGDPSGHSYDINLVALGQSTSGGYHNVFFASHPTCLSYAADITNPTVALDAVYTWTATSTPSPTATSSVAYDCVKDGTSTDCLIQVVDNPTLDYGMGVLAFMGTAVFVVWFFRKRNA